MAMGSLTTKLSDLCRRQALSGKEPMNEPIPKSKLWHVGVRAHRPNATVQAQAAKRPVALEPVVELKEETK